MNYKIVLPVLFTTIFLFVPTFAGCKSTAEMNYQYGLDLAQNGQYFDALAKFNECIVEEPDNPEAFNSCGALSVLTGHYQTAVADLNNAIYLEPELPVAYNNRGVAYVYQGDYDRAIEDFRQALNLDPNYADAASNQVEVMKMADGKDEKNQTRICVALSQYVGGRGSQPTFSLVIGKAIDIPVLLVHGFQVTEYNLNRTWSAMVESLAARDVDRDSELIQYTSDSDGSRFSIKRVRGNVFTLYISNYTHNISLGTSLDIREYSQGLAEEIKAVKRYEGVDQVDVVAHSMGGLVVRSYIESEDFTDNPYPVTYGGDVRKLLMLGTPNEGTYYPEPFYDVMTWKSVQQMNVGSQFLVELNKGVTGQEKGVVYYGIAGSAYECGEEISDPLAEVICVLSGEMDNDGVVPVESVRLEKQGDKEEIPSSRWYVTPLTHLELSDYPGAVIVKEILKEG
jgi:Flp pilus assembly protein TadD/uncharacterized alpha/beta hydrolase family protein